MTKSLLTFSSCSRRSLGITFKKKNLLPILHLTVLNKTGLQPVSRPVEQIVGFFHKDFKMAQKKVQTYERF